MTVLGLTLCSCAAWGIDAAAAPGLGPAGAATALELAAALPGPVVRIDGPDARVQLLASSIHETGQRHDRTRTATYAVEPADLLTVDPAGLATPRRAGAGAIRATWDRQTAILRVEVANFDVPAPIDFAHAIVPIFTKFGCNGGGCHGKSGGQNGFRLSLLGFEPEKDYQFIVRESRGRRVFPAAPERSLLVRKATGEIAHGGGARVPVDGLEHRKLLRWIAQGALAPRPDAARVAKLEVRPATALLAARGAQQLAVVATYADGRAEDVTRLARFEANDKTMAEASGTGLVTLLGQPGSVAVMVRCLDHATVFSATAPLGHAVENLPAPGNLIDTHVFARWRELGLPPSPRCDDPTYLRRATLDVCGRLPTLAEARAFAADGAADKRTRAVDRLLASDDYAAHFAGAWSAVLRNRRVKDTYQRGAYRFHEWLKAAFAANLPYDEFAAAILTASGEIDAAPPVAWYRAVSQTSEQVEDVSQLFLGTRLQCAACHHHPYEKWSQQDYYGVAAFFSTVEYRDGDRRDERRVLLRRAAPEARNPATGKAVPPAGLGGPPLAVGRDDDPRAALAAWMTDLGNPYFATALVNRYWKRFLGRGVVEAEDDLRATNPPSNPALLAALAADFAGHGYDLKRLIRMICASAPYQLSSQPTAQNVADRQNYARFHPRRLPAEALLDALDQTCGTSSDLPGLPKGGRAVDLPDQFEGSSPFLNAFGRPAGASACECERAGETSLAQSLHLLNAQELHRKVAGPVAERIARETKTPDADHAAELYWRAFGRAPTAPETAAAEKYLAAGLPAQRRERVEDLLWALLNTKEFLFNH